MTGGWIVGVKVANDVDAYQLYIVAQADQQLARETVLKAFTTLGMNEAVEVIGPASAARLADFGLTPGAYHSFP